MRTVIDVPDEIVQALDRESASKQRSRASIIREVLANHTAELNKPKMKEAFGLWAEKAEDGVSYQDNLRNEWDKE